VADVVPFHHALGLTAGCHALAEELRAAGHIVHTPDLYDGAVYTSLDDGLAHLERAGFDEVVQRGCDAVAGLPDRLVYVGISLGAMPAQRGVA
jgi:dienelactone hydrolase